MEYNGIAPCGIDCVNCELFTDNSNLEVMERLSAATGKSVEDLKCSGCPNQSCPLVPECATLACVRERGLETCGDCGDFPCAKLLPAADQAGRLPHNLKVYNLCTIKTKGVAALLAEAKENRRRYFGGTMVIGSGPLFRD